MISLSSLLNPDTEEEPIKERKVENLIIPNLSLLEKQLKEDLEINKRTLEVEEESEGKNIHKKQGFIIV